MKKRTLLLIAVAVFMAACSNADTKSGIQTTDMDSATNSSQATTSNPEKPGDDIIRVEEKNAEYYVRPDYFGNLDEEHTETFNRLTSYAQNKIPFDFSMLEERAGAYAIQVVHTHDGRQISLAFNELDEDEYKGYYFMQHYLDEDEGELYPVADDKAEEILDFVEKLRKEGSIS